MGSEVWGFQLGEGYRVSGVLGDVGKRVGDLGVWVWFGRDFKRKGGVLMLGDGDIDWCMCWSRGLIGRWLRFLVRVDNFYLFIYFILGLLKVRWRCWALVGGAGKV